MKIATTNSYMVNITYFYTIITIPNANHYTEQPFPLTTIKLSITHI